MNPLQPDELRLLTEVGFVAAARGELQSATQIFQALEICRPNAGFSYAGLAVAKLARARYDDALQVLARGLATVAPDDAQDLHALRALVCHMAGRTSECARAIQAAGDHPLARSLTTAAA